MPLIYPSATLCWVLKEEKFNSKIFPKPYDNMFPIVTEKKFLALGNFFNIFYINPTIVIMKTSKNLLSAIELMTSRNSGKTFGLGT